MNRCANALAMMVLCIASSAIAQEVCIDFLENHTQDPAWEKTCVDALGELTAASMLTAGSQSQQSMGMGAAGLFAETPINVSV